MCGKADFIELLLDHGANVDSKSLTDVTPVHVAAQCGQCDALEVLVRRGADVNAATNDGATPLHLAARFNQYYAVGWRFGWGRMSMQRTARVILPCITPRIQLLITNDIQTRITNRLRGGRGLIWHGCLCGMGQISSDRISVVGPR